jgi:hypothetical protein
MYNGFRKKENIMNIEQVKTEIKNKIVKIEDEDMMEPGADNFSLAYQSEGFELALEIIESLEDKAVPEKHTVKIHWGEYEHRINNDFFDEIDSLDTSNLFRDYEFNTKEELNAFILGITESLIDDEDYVILLNKEEEEKYIEKMRSNL